MKPILLSDGIGVITGHLCDYDRLQADVGGEVKTFTLKGNVVDTEGYDVFAIGRQTGENEFQVELMESLANAAHPFGIYGKEVGGRFIEIVTFTNESVKNVKTEMKNEAKICHVDVTVKEGEYLHLTMKREAYAPSQCGGSICLIPSNRETNQSGIKVVSEQRGSNEWAKKTVTARYAYAIQLLS